MTVALKERGIAALASAPPPVREAFIKQMSFLAQPATPFLARQEIRPSQRCIWQARINDDWRFYFTIDDDTSISSRSLHIQK